MTARKKAPRACTHAREEFLPPYSRCRYGRYSRYVATLALNLSGECHGCNRCGGYQRRPVRPAAVAGGSPGSPGAAQGVRETGLIDRLRARAGVRVRVARRSPDVHALVDAAARCDRCARGPGGMVAATRAVRGLAVGRHLRRGRRHRERPGAGWLTARSRRSLLPTVLCFSQRCCSVRIGSRFLAWDCDGRAGAAPLSSSSGQSHQRRSAQAVGALHIYRSRAGRAPFRSVIDRVAHETRSRGPAADAGNRRSTRQA